MTLQFSQNADDEDGDEPVLDPSARTAEGQGSNVPLKWKPTAREPVPVVRCTAIRANGERCKRWSLRGTTTCIKHGGQLPVVQDHANAVVEAARLRLVGLTDLAIDQIEDLMQNATGEGIRLKAAQDVLDRSGVKGAVEIDVTVKQEETAAERVRERLAEISARIIKQDEPKQEDVVDAELIEDAEEEDEDGR
jgi:hypothetical protein